jgi:hypothetical protein
VRFDHRSADCIDQGSAFKGKVTLEAAVSGLHGAAFARASGAGLLNCRAYASIGAYWSATRPGGALQASGSAGEIPTVGWAWPVSTALAPAGPNRAIRAAAAA